jgi:Lysozyme like domain
MRWNASELARFARDDDVVTATAVALATSGGIDQYVYQPGSPGVGRYVGLWGIDTDRWPDYADRTLQAPHVNAQTARELVEQYGGWGWSAAARAGTHLAHMAHAGTEASRIMATQSAHVDMGATGAGYPVQQTLATLARGRAMIRTLSMSQGFR